jgi:hypothetical protein
LHILLRIVALRMFPEESAAVSNQVDSPNAHYLGLCQTKNELVVPSLIHRLRGIHEDTP